MRIAAIEILVLKTFWPFIWKNLNLKFMNVGIKSPEIVEIGPPVTEIENFMLVFGISTPENPPCRNLKKK